MLKEIFHDSLKILKFTRFVWKTIQAWLGGKSSFCQTNPSNFWQLLQSLLSGLLIDCGKKVKFRGIFRDKIAEKLADFARIFWANLARKQSLKKWRILWLFSGQISLEIDRFCADQTSVFNVFLTEVIINYFALSTTIRSRNEPMAKPLTSWLVSSFSQHNLRLVVSESFFACFSDEVLT